MNRQDLERRLLLDECSCLECYLSHSLLLQTWLATWVGRFTHCCLGTMEHSCWGTFLQSTTDTLRHPAKLPSLGTLASCTGAPDVLRKWFYGVNSCTVTHFSFSVSFSTRGEDKTYSCCSIWVPAPCVRTPRWSWSRTLACRRSCTASPPPCGTPPCSQSGAPSCATAGNEGP